MAGQVVAWNYGFQFAGTWFWYQPAMEPAFQHYSPGFCLLSKIIEDACDDPAIRCVDLGLGAEEYKERFATHYQKTLNISLRSSRLSSCMEASRFYLANGLRRAPAVDRWVRTSLRERITSLRAQSESNVLELVRLIQKRVWEKLFGSTEVLFFEYGDEPRPNQVREAQLVLEPLSLKHLAAAACEYSNDPETLTYLVRAAKRLSQAHSQGFVIVNQRGVPVQFCWTTDFENFAMSELGYEVKAPVQNSVLLFDGFTPAQVRRNGFWTMAISKLALDLEDSGQSAWAFCGKHDAASRRAIEKAGFVQQFSLLRTRFFGKSHIARVPHFAPKEEKVAMVA